MKRARVFGFKAATHAFRFYDVFLEILTVEYLIQARACDFLELSGSVNIWLKCLVLTQIGSKVQYTFIQIESRQPIYKNDKTAFFFTLLCIYPPPLFLQHKLDTIPLRPAYTLFFFRHNSPQSSRVH